MSDEVRLINDEMTAVKKILLAVVGILTSPIPKYYHMGSKRTRVQSAGLWNK